jgi:hypothetical protein
MHYTSEPLVVE